jgi:hypothetical protein
LLKTLFTKAEYSETLSEGNGTSNIDPATLALSELYPFFELDFTFLFDLLGFPSTIESFCFVSACNVLSDGPKIFLESCF